MWKLIYFLKSVSLPFEEKVSHNNNEKQPPEEACPLTRASQHEKKMCRASQHNLPALRLKDFCKSGKQPPTTKMSKITSFKRVNADQLDFGKIQPRGTYFFCNTTYKTGPLTIDTPALITPTGIHAEDARNWMDLELDVASNEDHMILHDVIKSIDDRCIEESIKNRHDWFKGHVDTDFIEDQFKSPITSGWGNEPAVLRVEVVTSKAEDLCDSEGNNIEPQQVTALSSVQIQLQLIGLWVNKKFLGCHWRAIRVKANLDQQPTRKGRRRATTPPREPSNDSISARTRNILGRGSTAPASELSGKEAAREMLERFRAREAAAASTSRSSTTSTSNSSRYHEDDYYSDEDDYSDDDHYSSGGGRRHSSSYSDYSDDDSRRTDSRSYSDSDDSDDYSDSRTSSRDYRRRSDDSSDEYSDEY
jgi:hypothetical protein